jgi:amino-acid N-acetyltransferase
MIQEAASQVTLRRAVLDEVDAIHALISAHVGEHSLLPRSVAEIVRSIDDWILAVDDGRAVGCGSLISLTRDLAEVRSLVVEDTYQGNGLGGRLVQALVGLAYERRIPYVFALTTRVSFFERQGFWAVSRARFPLKIWRDCLRCPLKLRCNETTVLRVLEVGREGD